jgi:hypothetical protein
MAVPLACGIIYRLLFRDGDKALFRLWGKGWAIMTAVFSFLFAMFRIFGHVWESRYWRISGIVVVLAAVAACLISVMKKKSVTGDGEKTVIIPGYMIPVLVLVSCLFVFALFFLKPSERLLDNTNRYNAAYDAECMGAGADEPSEVYRYYLSLNSVTGVGTQKYLLIILPGTLLLISVCCYDFLASCLNVSERRRTGFLMLIYVIYIVPFFCYTYELYEIYRSVWISENTYMSLFLPFQFGMMVYVSQTVEEWRTPLSALTAGASEDRRAVLDPSDRGRLFRCLFWSLVAYLIGYMFPWKEWCIILAPEMAGVVLGMIRRAVGRSERHGMVS